MLSGAANGSVIYWRDRNVSHRFTGHTARINSLVVQASLDTLVTAAGDCTLRTWTLSSALERRVLSGHVLGVSGCTVM